jgi:hypothetical protein
MWLIKLINDILLKVANFNINFFIKALKGYRIPLSYPLKIKILLIVKLFNVLDLIRFMIRLTVFRESNLSLLTIKDNN